MWKKGKVVNTKVKVAYDPNAQVKHNRNQMLFCCVIVIVN